MRARPRPDDIQSYLAERAAVHDAAARALATRVHEVLLRGGLDATVVHRVKDAGSYLRKLERASTNPSGHRRRVTDWLGVRVICPFLSETERAEGVLRAAFPVVQVERKGTERALEEFGYDSIHLLVRLPDDISPRPPPGARPVFEVQIRTILQEAWAQIEHRLVYKNESRLPRRAMRRKLAALAATLTLADLTFEELRDDEAELSAQDARRRGAVPGSADGRTRRGKRGLVAPRRDVTRLARPDPTLRDPAERNLEASILEALGAHGRGDLDRAIELYGRVLRLRLPTERIRSVIYNHRGIAYLEQSRWREAARDFAAAIRWDPTNHRAHHNAGLVHRECGRRAAAIQCFRRACLGEEARASAEAALAEMDERPDR